MCVIECYFEIDLAKILKISVAQVRTAIKHLKTTNEITTRSASKFTIVTITNWAFYQSGEERVASEIASDVTSQSQANDKRMTCESQHLKNGRREEGKNEKKVVLNARGRFYGRNTAPPSKLR